MSGMVWIALELSIPKIGLKIMLSSTLKKLDAFKFDRVAESDNTELAGTCSWGGTCSDAAKPPDFPRFAKSEDPLNSRLIQTDTKPGESGLDGIAEQFL